MGFRDFDGPRSPGGRIATLIDKVVDGSRVGLLVPTQEARTAAAMLLKAARDVNQRGYADVPRGVYHDLAELVANKCGFALTRDKLNAVVVEIEEILRRAH